MTEGVFATILSLNRLGEVSSAFAFGGGNRQIELLEQDGIPCPGGRVDLKKYQWKAVCDVSRRPVN